MLQNNQQLAAILDSRTYVFSLFLSLSIFISYHFKHVSTNYIHLPRKHTVCDFQVRFGSVRFWEVENFSVRFGQVLGGRKFFRFGSVRITVCFLAGSQYPTRYASFYLNSTSILKSHTHCFPLGNMALPNITYITKHI